jgi:hypothetical protein
VIVEREKIGKIIYLGNIGNYCPKNNTERSLFPKIGGECITNTTFFIKVFSLTLERQVLATCSRRYFIPIKKQARVRSESAASFLFRFG